MKLHKYILMAVVCVWSAGAMAQWQWLDKDGRKVFSDRAPPQDIPEGKILKQPRFVPAARTAPASDAGETDAAAAPAPAKPASAPAASGKDKELEKKKAQAEADEAAKKKAQDEKQAAVRAENCKRAQQAKVGLESGTPMKQTNAQGERVFLDEAGRNAEIKRIQGIIDADCKR
jgi:hypothetical protein